MVRAIMWKLSIEDDQGQSTVVQLVRSEYSVGRTDENSIRLTERNISRKHARMVKQGAAWFLDDLGSYNGCFVNGLRVVDHHPINLGDLIQLGDYRLELHADDGVAVAPPQAARPRRADTLSTTLNLAAQTDRLVMVVGPTPGREYMLAHAPQRIGRGEECDICVNHSSVSRWHADLHYVGSSRYEMIDHDSSNGIRINGVDLRRGLLDARDLVELGDVVLKFIPAGQVYRPSPEESRQLAALLGVEADGPAPTRLERLSLVWHALSRTTRWGTVLLGMVVIVLLGLTILTNRKGLSLSPDLIAQPTQPYRELLSDAMNLLNRGQFAAAHEKALKIPASSNLRNDPEFLLIEKRWADDLRHQADISTDPEERRKLLETISQATTVDALTRKQAADALEAMRVEAVKVNELPSSPSSTADVKDAPDSSPAPSNDVAGDTPNGSASANVKDNIGEVRAPEVPQPKVSKRLQPRTAGATATHSTTNGSGSPSKPTTQSGADLNATELATSGNLESLKAARDALKRKVTAGSATDREVRLLRALCRQLGDTTCPH
jgi:ABC transport system ATP-binding/permease protein